MVACSGTELAAPASAETRTQVFWGEAKGLPSRGNGLSWADLADEEDEEARRAAQERAPSSAEEGNVKLLKGLWFVKEPKPPSNNVDIRSLEKQVEDLGIQVRRHTEDLEAKKVEKSMAKRNTLAAKKTLREAQCRVKGKRNEIKKLRESVKWASRDQRNVIDRRSDVPKTEAGLSKLIKETEYRLQHESISFREETELVGKLAKLNALRVKARSESSVSGNSADSLTLEKELQILVEEEISLRQVYQQFEALEQDVDRDLEQIAKMRCIKNEAKSKALSNLRLARQCRRDKTEIYSRNRDFSRTIRQLVAEGCIEKAREACEQQVEEMLNKMEDPDCRRLYLVGYEVKHDPKFSNGRSKRPVNASLHHKHEARSMSADTAMESRQNSRLEATTGGKSKLLNACNQLSTHEAHSLTLSQNGNSQLEPSIDCSQSTSASPPGARGKELAPEKATLQDTEIPLTPLTISREDNLNSSQDKKRSKRKKKTKKGLAELKNPSVLDSSTKEHVCERLNLPSGRNFDFGESNSRGAKLPTAMTSPLETRALSTILSGPKASGKREPARSNLSQAPSRRITNTKPSVGKVLRLLICKAVIAGALIFGLIAFMNTLVA